MLYEEAYALKFTFAHNNINVLDLEKSIAFYKEALGFTEERRLNGENFTIVFLTDGETKHRLELTWLKDREEPYNLGDNEFHLAVYVDDMEEAHKFHEQMGCICYENTAMGLYFIADPDGYWTEILPAK